MSSPSSGEKELLDACKALGLDSKEKLEELVKSKSPSVTVSTNQPRISIFYGDTEKLVKGECLYDQWRYEVRTMVMEKVHKPEVILQAIRKSVKGEASRVLMRLNPKAGIAEILAKFDSVYGVVESKESMLAEFYSARQKEEESTTEWSCRLEDILAKVEEMHSISSAEANKMLCSMLWTGLRQDLKDITAYKFDTIKDFDELRTEIRKVEKGRKEVKKEVKTSVTKSAVNREEKDKETEDLKGMISSLATSVSQMERKLEDLTSNRMQQGNNRNFGNGFGDRKNRYENVGGARGRGQMQRGRGVGRGQGNWTFGKYGRGGRDQEEGPLCFRCRRRGHLQWECKAEFDNSRNLNK